MTAYDAEQARAFVDAIYGELEDGEHLSLVWAVTGHKRLLYDVFIDVEDLLDRAQEVDGFAHSTWLRVTSLSRRPFRGRGDAAASRRLFGLWSDLDYGAAGHKHDPDKHGGLILPPDDAAALTVVAASALPPPTLVVNSGGGLYTWHLLDAPTTIDDGSRSQLTALAADWQQALAAGSERLGYYYGAGVGDLPRVLRLPGSVNRKTPVGRPCRVVSDDGPRYSLEALCEALDMAGRVVEPARSGGTVRAAREPYGGLGGGNGPFDVLDREVGPGGVLERAGWTWHDCARLRGAETVECWTRPGGGSSSDCSAVVLRANPHVAVVHSEDAGLPSGRDQRLTAGRLFALLWHDGDESAAASDLLAAMAGGGSDAARALGLPVTLEPPRRAVRGGADDRDAVALLRPLLREVAQGTWKTPGKRLDWAARKAATAVAAGRMDAEWAARSLELTGAGAGVAEDVCSRVVRKHLGGEQ